MRQNLTWLGALLLCEAAALGGTMLLPSWQPNPLAAALALGLALALIFARWKTPRALRNIQGKWILPASAHAWSEITLGASLVAARHTPPIALEAWLQRRFEPLARLAGLTPEPIRPTWATRFTKRGINPLPPLFVRCSLPFGLVSAYTIVCPAGEFLVYPALGSMHRDLQTRLQRWLDSYALTKDAGDDEISRLREYRPGDHPHSIHWKASARRLSLQVVERQAAGARRIALVVDTSAGGDAGKVEKLLSVAATLVDYFCAEGWSLTLYGNFAPQGLDAGRQCLMETLALAELQPGSFTQWIPQNRASVVLSQHPLEPASVPHSALVLTLAECEQMVILPKRVR